MKHILLLLLLFATACSVRNPTPPQPPPTPERFGVNMGAGNQYGEDQNQRLSGLLADTGVRWAYVPVFWAWAEPTPGDYRFDGLDATIQTLLSRGVEPVIQIRGWPAWVSGSECEVSGVENRHCARIFNTHKQLFRDSLQDFSFALASRYPNVLFWSAGNEPNLSGYFSPEPSYLGGPAHEYVSLLFEPIYSGVTVAIPGAVVFGPELYTCYDGGKDCTQRDDNWGLKTNWISDWAEPLLRGYETAFPVFSIHNYSSDDFGIRSAVEELKSLMVKIDRVRPIWTTEFNFGSGTCPGNTEALQREIANLTCRNYLFMTWDRAFYFDLSGNGCFSLTIDDAPKTFLYPAFRSIVEGSYYCD